MDHVKRVRDRYQCDTLVCLGDEIDGHAFSPKFKPNPDLASPGDELELAIESLTDWYDEFPEMTVVESNHSSRIVKKALSAGLPSAVLKEYSKIIQAPAGWHFRELGHEIDEVFYHHGEGFNQTSWRSAHNRLKTSNVLGHLHAGAGIQFSQSRRERWFSMNAGCLINPEHPAFNYARFVHERAVLGCAVVIDGDPIFIPMK